MKRRLKPLNSAYDIYNLGLSIQENQITNKLASDIIKPQQQHHQQQPNTEEINHLNGLNDVTIIDDNNKTIIEKLIELTKQNSQLVKENMNLSKRVISVEAKIDRILANLPTHQQHQLTPMPIQTPQHRLQTELFNLAADPEINNESSKNQNYNLPAKSNQTRSSYRDITALQDHNTSQQHKPAAPSKNQISQHKQSSPPKSVVYGGRQNNKTNITGKTKPFSLFIGGFHLDLDKESVKSFIEREAHIQVIDIELNRKNKYNQSFKVDINTHDKQRASDPSNWVEGLVIKSYRIRKTINNQNQLSYRQHQYQNDRNNYNNNYHNDFDNNGWEQNY